MPEPEIRKKWREQIAREHNMYTINDLFEMMRDENAICFNGVSLVVNGIRRESGGKPCRDWLIELSDGHTYYWNSRLGHFGPQTAVMVK